jgi:nucleotide-binding universal stress UspA family protein
MQPIKRRQIGNVLIHMPQIKKILFPVDFSKNCLGAARYVQAFAGLFEAEVMLFHAVVRGQDTLAAELLPLRKDELDKFLVEDFKYFTTHRVCKTTEDPPSAIADAARSWGPDLVMMPTHGVGYFRRHLLGSATAKTLHDLTCPVWTSLHAESAPPLEKIHCRKILCSLDSTENGRRVLEWAAWLAGQCQASLGIVHATGAPDAPASVGWYVGEEFARQVSAQAKTWIETLQSETGTSVKMFINPGHPAKVVASAAGEFGADLLVMGRHGGGAGIAGHLFQNAYAILCESPCPVISV